MKIDMSLKNKWLYSGCTIVETNGRLTCETKPSEASQIVGRNIEKFICSYEGDREKITLSGPMAVWAYLLVLHAVVHRFVKVYYHDGRNEPILISYHP